MHSKWWVLATVACGTFLATLDSSIVNIALPTLTKVFGTDLHQTKWVVVVYLLVITCMLLPFGRVSDQYGRKRIFQIGFFTFTVASVFCGLANNLGVLVLARVLQAVGVSMLMANGPAIITAAFPSNERGGALGTLAMVVSIGLLSGPSVGGFIISQFGWRMIFLINIPFGIAGIFLAARYLRSDHAERKKAPFDWGGAILQSVLLLSFIVIFDPPRISISGSLPFAPPRWAMMVVTTFLLVLFLKVESDAKAPLFDLSLLKNRVFWTANLASFFTFVAFSSLSVLMPFFLEEAMSFPTQHAGLLMTAIPLTILVVAPIAGRLSDRLGSRGLSFGGAMIGAIGLFGMAGAFGAGLHAGVHSAWIVISLCSIGFATGLFQSPNNNAIMGAVPPNKLGVASALLATVRNLGLVTGTGLATSVFVWRRELTGDFVGSLHVTLWISGVVSLAAMLASLGKGRARPLYHRGESADQGPHGHHHASHHQHRKS